MRDLRREAPIVLLALGCAAGRAVAEYCGVLGAALLFMIHLALSKAREQSTTTRSLRIASLAASASAFLCAPAHTPAVDLGPRSKIVRFEGTLLGAPRESAHGAWRADLDLGGGARIELTIRDARRGMPGARGMRVRGIARYDPPAASAHARLVTDRRLVESAPLPLLESLRDAARRHVRTSLRDLSTRARAFCARLMIGVGELADEDLRAHRDTGLAHLLAISGLHAVFLASLLLALLRALVRPQRMRFVLLCAGLMFYAFLCGGRAPVTRAVLGFALWEFARMRGRATAIAPLLAVAFCASFALAGEGLESISLRMSFAAVLGIAILGGGPGKSRSGIASTLRVSAAAWLATAAFALEAFGRASPWGIVLTPLAVPGVLACLLLATLQCALALLPGSLGISLGAPLETLAHLQLDMVRLFADLPGTPVLASAQPPSGLASTLWILGALIAWLRNSRRAFALSCAFALAPFCLPTAITHARAAGTPGDFVRVLAVGHGQCVFARISGRSVVIDCGDRVHGERAARALLTNMRALGMAQIDDFILSHGDQDHHSGLRALLARVRIRRAWMPESPKVAASMRILQKRGRVQILAPGARATAREGVVLHSPLEEGDLAPSNEGALLCVLTLEGRRQVVVFGDQEEAGCAAARRRLEGSSVDAILVPHHGAFQAGLPALLDALRPGVTLASRGARSPLPIQWEQDRRLRPYRPMSTGEHGDIELRASGTGCRIITREP